MSDSETNSMEPSPVRWILVAPDWSLANVLWHNPNPFVLWPVCGKPLLGWWLDEAVRQGVRHVTVVAVDRPHNVRAWLDEGDLWSRSLEVVTTEPREAIEPGTVRIEMSGLPGNAPSSPSPGTGGELLRHWLAMQSQALASRDPMGLHLDREIAPGVWVAPGCSISPEAQFTGPAWIGPCAKLGRGCHIGPHAFVGAGCMLDEDVEVQNAVVCDDTYVGRHLTVANAVVVGGMLVDLSRDVVVRIAEDFILAPLNVRRPGWPGRIAAAILGPLLRTLARVLCGARSTPPAFELPNGEIVHLAERTSGPLILRRAEWLRAVAAGKLAWSGPLPRTAVDWATLPPDVAAVLRNTSPGVLSLADLYGCHSAATPDEWLHALYQCASPEGVGRLQLRRRWLHAALLNPKAQ